MKRIVLALLGGLAPVLVSAATLDANGVMLGDAESSVQKAFPGIRCKPLEWNSDAADRRCDNARVQFAGVDARVTFYLKANSVRGFDVRFESSKMDLVAAYLRDRFGKPVSETREKIQRKNKEPREVFKILWVQGKDKAVLSTLSTGKRASLSVSRDGFEDEIYRVK